LGHRRKARVLALQLLYQIDLTQGNLEESVAELWPDLEALGEAHSFAMELVRGVRHRLEQIDSLIQTSSDHWRVGRMPLVDRNILRLAVYELLFCPQIPGRVSINEAVELAKRFGAEESGAFINGVLDQIRVSRIGAETREVSQIDH
jgi:transcription antitermination protein NusB